MTKSIAPLMLTIVLVVVQAGASVVTSIPGGTVIPIPAVDCSAPLFSCFGPGPSTFGPGVVWSSTNVSNGGGAVFGFTDPFQFGGNGSWTSPLPPIADVNSYTDLYGTTDSMTFAFKTPVSAVGGFLNYAPGNSTPTTIAVYSCDPSIPGCNPIELPFELTFTFSPSDENKGAFYGFQESSADIRYFVLTDNFIGIKDLTVSAVPEPGSLLLLGSGLLGVINNCRKRFRL